MSKCAPSNRVNQFFPGTLGEVDSLLNQFFTPTGAARTGWSTPATLYEHEGRLHVEIDAPGVDAEKIDVTVENQRLSITLERSVADDAPKPVYNERRFGKVTRTLELPDTVDSDSVEAELNAGVLHVSIAQRPETQPRRVEVRKG